MSCPHGEKLKSSVNMSEACVGFPKYFMRNLHYSMSCLSFFRLSGQHPYITMVRVVKFLSTNVVMFWEGLV